MRKKDIRLFLIIVGPMFILGLIAYFISINSSSTHNVSFIVNGMNFWKYDNNLWKSFIDIDDLDWKKYAVYSNNRFIDNYFVTITNDKTYFFDKNNDSYDVEFPYLAISVESDIKPVNYKSLDISDDDIKIINSYLKKNKINYNGDYSEEKKYVVDINGDNKDDYIYIISNELYSLDKVFYSVFAYCNNKYVTIDLQIDSDEIVHYDLSWVLNMKHNGYYNIILTEPREYDEKYYLYEYNNQNRQFNLVFNE